MKRKLSILLFSLMFSSVVFAEKTVTKTEYITEEVCEAITGCWLNPLTGDCPDCVTITRKIVTEVEVEEEKKEVIVARVERPKKSKSKWTCVVGPCDFQDYILHE